MVRDSASYEESLGGSDAEGLLSRGVTRRTLSRALVIDRKNIGRKIGHGFTAQQAERLHEMVAALPVVGGEGKRLEAWLKTPHPLLLGTSPVDLISIGGDVSAVATAWHEGLDSLEPLSRNRWWLTGLVLAEVQGRSVPEVVKNLRDSLATSEWSNGHELPSVVIRWLWHAVAGSSSFVVMEVSHLSGLPNKWRWIPWSNRGISMGGAWDPIGFRFPIREALLTHWHSHYDSPLVGAMFGDLPVAEDSGVNAFDRRRLLRPGGPPWVTDEAWIGTAYLRRLTDPVVAHRAGRWPPADLPDGARVEAWSLERPLGEEPEIVRVVGQLRSQADDDSRRSGGEPMFNGHPGWCYIESESGGDWFDARIVRLIGPEG